MLRRREPSPYSGSSLPTTTTRTSPYGTQLPMVRNFSVATSNPSFHEHMNVGRSFFFSSSPAASPRFPSKTSSNVNKNVWLYYIPALLLLISPWIFPQRINNEITTYRNEIQELQTEQRNAVKQIESMTSSVRETNTKIHSLNKDNEMRFKELRENGGFFTRVNLDTEQYDEVEQSEEGILSRLDLLEQNIQRTSAKLAVQKYGSEPFRVKVTLADVRSSTSYFVIELAPLSEMPHAVYHFLQMVDQKLWDGLCFILGRGSVETTSPAPLDYWVAQPMQMDMQHGHHAWQGQRFEAANLTHLAFTEHSTNYPAPGKYKYSLAFSGHPGGPSFYIRMDGAEESVVDVHQQTSTFGAVVEGMDVLDRYWQQSGHGNSDEVKDTSVKSSNHLELLTIQSMELIRS